jgi:DNA-binding transcriptional regulator YiaG
MKKSARKTMKASVTSQRSTEQSPSPAAVAKLSLAGAKIVGAFEETIALIRTGKPPERHFTVRTYKVEFTPRAYGPDDVRRVRGLLGMSQVLFARFLGVDANTVRSWEQGTRPPSPIARRFMDEIEGDPDHWRQRIIQNAATAESKPEDR